MAYTNYIYVRHHNIELIEDVLSINSVIYILGGFQKILKKIYSYYTYFEFKFMYVFFDWLKII